MEEFDLPLHAYINCDAIIGESPLPNFVLHAPLATAALSVLCLLGIAHGFCIQQSSPSCCGLCIAFTMCRNHAWAYMAELSFGIR